MSASHKKGSHNLKTMSLPRYPLLPITPRFPLFSCIGCGKQFKNLDDLHIHTLADLDCNEWLIYNGFKISLNINPIERDVRIITNQPHWSLLRSRYTLNYNCGYCNIPFNNWHDAFGHQLINDHWPSKRYLLFQPHIFLSNV